MPNRTVAPPLREITSLQLPEPEVIHLDNGVPVYIIKMGTQPVVKMELVFEAGRWLEDKKLVSRATSQLLKEGTKFHNGEEIAEIVDFYGGTIAFPADLDTSNLILFCLTKHFDKLLPLVDEILTAPAFDEDDLAKFKRRSHRRLKMDLGKADVVAYRQITESIFGKKHPYGYNSQPRLFDGVSRADIVHHFETHYRAGNLKIFLSGLPTENVLEALNNTIGKNIKLGKTTAKPAIYKPNPTKTLRIDKLNSVQSAIRIGCRTFNRNHPDYKGLYVLNTILGGYFGARLMTNLREDKGYTYGVYSNLEPMTYDGYLNISTEVAKGSADKALTEIYKEFEKLRVEPVSQAELQMVRNYLLGYLLTGLDGPFSVVEIVKTFTVEKVEPGFYDSFVNTIKTITPEEIQALANKYLRKENMYEIVVG